MLHEEDRLRLGVDDATPGLHSVCILRHMPCVFVEIGDCGEDSGHGAGIVAVKACISLSFPVNVTLKDADEEAVRMLSVKARREQVCLVVSNASTLYTLQGTTCEPDLPLEVPCPPGCTDEVAHCVHGPVTRSNLGATSIGWLGCEGSKVY